MPVLGEMFTASGARDALDLFTGTTRVAQEFKRRGGIVTTVDTARYSEVFARCYIETDRDAVDLDALAVALERLDALDGVPGYFTETFCCSRRATSDPRTGPGSTRSAPRSTPSTATRRSSRSC